MKKKIGLLCGLLICVVILGIILWVQLRGNQENKGNGRNQEIVETDSQTGADSQNDSNQNASGNEASIDNNGSTENNCVTGDSDGTTSDHNSNNSVTNEEQENSEAWDSYNRIRNSIVKIDMGDLSGSGVVFSISEEEIIIATSGHLLQQYESGVVTFSNGVITIGWVQGSSSVSDVGFISVLKSDIDTDKISMIEPVAFDLDAFEKIENETEIFQVGSTSGVAADFYIGSISAKEWYFEEFDSYMLYNFCKATPGMSGGGCFTFDGNLIGLISGSYMEESCALPLPAILEAYDEIMKIR